MKNSMHLLLTLIYQYHTMVKKILSQMCSKMMTWIDKLQEGTRKPTKSTLLAKKGAKVCYQHAIYNFCLLLSFTPKEKWRCGAPKRGREWLRQQRSKHGGLRVQCDSSNWQFYPTCDSSNWQFYPTCDSSNLLWWPVLICASWIFGIFDRAKYSILRPNCKSEMAIFLIFQW